MIFINGGLRSSRYWDNAKKIPLWVWLGLFYCCFQFQGYVKQKVIKPNMSKEENKIRHTYKHTIL